VMPAGYPGDAFRSQVCTALQRKFEIAHATIQIEVADTEDGCNLAPHDVV